MSSSRVYKNLEGFQPEQLVSRSKQGNDGWQPATIPEEAAESENIHRQQQDDKRITQEADHDPADSTPKDELFALQSDQTSEPDDDRDAAQQQMESALEAIPTPAEIEDLKEKVFQQGVQEGLRQAEADYGSSTLALFQACEQLSSIRETILVNSKSELIEMIIAFSEKIIRHSVTEQDQTIIDTVEEAMHQAVKSSEFYIFLNPEDMAAIKERSNDFVAGLNGLENIIVKSDPAIERGGCRIESENCTVDATMSSQLEIINDRLRDDR
jgi:flagellar assembly protein FliH